MSSAPKIGVWIGPVGAEPVGTGSDGVPVLLSDEGLTPMRFAGWLSDDGLTVKRYETPDLRIGLYDG